MCKEEDRIISHLLETVASLPVQSLKLPIYRPLNLSEKGSATPIIADTCVIPNT